MLEYIEGKIVEKKTTYVIIEITGIGYFINIPISTYDNIKNIGEECKLFIHLSVRENDLTLFGFSTLLERKVFRMLIKVSGIGPKIALSILSGLTIPNLTKAIAENKAALLSTVPGIGKKSAQRIIVELKENFEKLYMDSVKDIGIHEESKEIIIDAQNALISLGYNKNIVTKAIRNYVKKHNPVSSEDIVKSILKELYLLK